MSSPMTPEEFLKPVRDEMYRVTADEVIDSSRITLKPSTDLFVKAPGPSLLRDPNFGRYVTILQIQALKGRREFKLREPFAF